MIMYIVTRNLCLGSRSLRRKRLLIYDLGGINLAAVDRSSPPDYVVFVPVDPSVAEILYRHL